MTLKVLRTMYPYLTDDEKERFRKLKQEIKEKGITFEDEARRIFKEIGVNLETELIDYY